MCPGARAPRRSQGAGRTSQSFTLKRTGFWPAIPIKNEDFLFGPALGVLADAERTRQRSRLLPPHPKDIGDEPPPFHAAGVRPRSGHSPLLWDDLVNGTYQLSERTRVITGHFGGFLPLWLKRRPRIVTILREPLARALSHINHVQRESRHPLHALAARLTVDQYCEHPVLRRTVDNFQSRYLASLDFAMTMMPRPSECSAREPHGSISVGFENALHSLDKETGLLDAAVRALSAIDAVGICEAHGASLRVFARVLDWDVEFVESALNHATGQKTLGDLSTAEMDALASLNRIDTQVYGHAVGRFLRLSRQNGIELNASETSALTRRSRYEPRSN